MTIHKAKGLGFDVVVVPDVPTDGIPQTQRFYVAEGDGWISQTPPKWARDILPEMREAEARWATDQRYEAFCMLYVALTRAKRGLYVLLEPPSKTRADDRASLANWLEQALGAGGEPGIIYQSGAADWIEAVPLTKTQELAAPPAALGTGVARRERSTPSSAKHQAAGGPVNPVSLALSDRTTGILPVREDSASRLSAHETTGWKPVFHDRQDAYPPARLTVSGILPGASNDC